MMEKNNIDFENIISKAYETLIIQDNLLFPLDVFNIKLNLNMKIKDSEKKIMLLESEKWGYVQFINKSNDGFMSY